ncbi:low-temperature viability protein ltv1 [Arthroderma uncinatum]|uniref:low-temperature viability protein ltv1 n=1 Tax=Arthroderma uncinatum TaxID=74035 RepID=UPI00144AEC88|nr:low-temperature viability protein ltv1 [Arthroderma uncinatum]KAF3482412.1 low-temperature viability protein ltv1 [Arthroderma uncinatum]
MPPTKQWIDKKSATKYQLFHRSQHDPLIHDPEAEDRILHVVGGPGPTASTTSSSSKRETGTLRDLDKEFSSATRKNEGEAANYGIFYDDTKYDYMQHLRGLGEGVGDTHFVEAKSKGKGKKGMKLEDALREVSLDGDGPEGSIYSGAGDDFQSTASSYVRRATYQDQQDIPDAIAGFQPGMDPRLREALEALEDDAYVDEECEDDIFESLVSGGHDAEVDPDEWRDTYIEDDDEGWESDATEKAPVQHDNSTTGQSSGIPDNSSGSVKSSQPPNDDQIPDMEEHEGDWLRDFAKYKKEVKGNKPTADGGENASEHRTTASTLFTLGGTPIRKKKRKGAQTNPSAYSMTSSSLARTDGHRLLDDRFERMEALYALDEEGEEYEGSSMADDMSVVSGLSRYSKLSQAPSLVSQGGGMPLRSDFNDVMDGFLDKWDDRRVHAKRKGAQGRRGKNGNEVIGIKMLDEVRKGLGPPRLSTNAFGKV